MNRRYVLGLAGAALARVTGAGSQGTPTPCGMQVNSSGAISYSGDGQGFVSDPFLLRAGTYRFTVKQTTGDVGGLAVLTGLTTGDYLGTVLASGALPFSGDTRVRVERSVRVVLDVEMHGAWTATLMPLI